MDHANMSLPQLRERAKELDIKNISRLRKAELAALIATHEEKLATKAAPQPNKKPKSPPRGKSKKTADIPSDKPALQPKGKNEHVAEIQSKDIADDTPEDIIPLVVPPPEHELPTIPDYELPPPDNTPEISEISEPPPPHQETAEGVLEILPDGFGFLRVNNLLPSSGDVYISPTQIRRFNLRTGDMVCGITRSGGADKFSAISYIQHVNGDPPYMVTRRQHFEYLTPIFPTERITLEIPGRSARHEMAPRLIDLLSPIGFGQRGMIVSPPKAGKTMLLKQIANSITHNYPDVHLIVVLIDERPEEVTDMQRSIIGEHCTVVSSTFDEQPENHKRVAEMVLERAKRLVEQKKDLVILLDSITRLGRAYNLTIPAGGRTLSGGLDPSALYMPKKFFGAARNVEEGGSLTVLATALVDTGSKMDDVIFEEFKGTGNMELVLDRRMAERRVFPAIDIMRSGTRREDLLLSARELDAMYTLREMSGKISSQEFSEKVTDMLIKSQDNKAFVDGFMEIRKY